GTPAAPVAAQNEVRGRRPALPAALSRDTQRGGFGEEAERPDGVYALPIFGVRDGKFTSHYSLTFIEIAQMVPGVPPLSAAQREGIELLMALADELSFEMRFEPGDMQLLNNHVVYHARTAFEDDADTGAVRRLYRLWLSMPNSRALPAGHEVLWGRIEAGALRGGIGRPDLSPRRQSRSARSPFQKEDPGAGRSSIRTPALPLTLTLPPRGGEGRESQRSRARPIRPPATTTRAGLHPRQPTARSAPRAMPAVTGSCTPSRASV